MELFGWTEPFGIRFCTHQVFPHRTLLFAVQMEIFYPTLMTATITSLSPGCFYWVVSTKIGFLITWATGWQMALHHHSVVAYFWDILNHRCNIIKVISKTITWYAYVMSWPWPSRMTSITLGYCIGTWLCNIVLWNMNLLNYMSRLS